MVQFTFTGSLHHHVPSNNNDCDGPDGRIFAMLRHDVPNSVGNALLMWQVCVDVIREQAVNQLIVVLD